MSDNTWILIGFLGQFFFFMRFIIQWIVSEKKGESVIPVVFWYFSLAGAFTLFFYAIHRNDPVFYCGYVLSVVIYTRNLYLVFKRKQNTKTEN